MTGRIGRHVTHIRDDTARVGQVVALVRGRPGRVIVCWSRNHDHDETHVAECTVEHVDQLQSRTTAVRP